MQISILIALFFVLVFAHAEVVSFELSSKSGKKCHKLEFVLTANALSGTSETTHPLSRLATSYNNKLEQFPILTKIITSGAIAAFGDVAVQYITKAPDAKVSIDKKVILQVSFTPFRNILQYIILYYSSP